MFGFGKSSKKKKSKKQKKSGADENDFYRPKPVSLQRNWRTGAKQKKASAKQASHKAHRSGSSNSLNRKQPIQPPEPQPEKKPDPPSEPPPPQHTQSVQNIQSNPNLHQSKPIQSQSTPLKHSQTTHDVNSAPSYPINGTLYEHKSADSDMSMNSALSTQSAPHTYNTYNNNNQASPHSAMAAWQQGTNARQQGTNRRQHIPAMSNKLSEGISQPQTGQPEVVGDISSWRALQQQKQQQQQHNYPNLSQPHDGMIGTGVAAVAAGGGYSLEQSRTSGTGHNGFGGINGVKDQYYNQNNSRLQSAADEPETIIPSSISEYNPNFPAANVPPEESDSSSDDADLNALMSGDAFKVAEDSDGAENEQIKHAERQEIQKRKQKQKQANDNDEAKEAKEIKQEEKEEKEEEQQAVHVQEQAAAVAVEEKEEKAEDVMTDSDDEDDGGLSDWLILIGFKKKKLALMLHALSELGLDTMEDLEEFLTDLYKNSYGNQQKQWMDKIQKDIIDGGIKYAQWIRFSTKAQSLIEEKVKQTEKKEDGNAYGIENKMNKINNVNTDNKSAFIVMQSEEALVLENLRTAMSVIYSGIDNMDKLVLNVEQNEKNAIVSIEKEFVNLMKQIETRKNILIDSISKVGEDKNSILGKQNTNLRSIAAEYEETMHSFNSILADNQDIRGKMEINKRQKTLTHLVSTVLHRHNNVDLTPKCTPLIGFHCNMTPVVLELNKVGVVTWGNAPQPPYITRIMTTDWSITVEYDDKAQQRNINVAQDPIILYEIECVLCENIDNLLWNFTQKEKSKKDKRHFKKKHGVMHHGIVTKQVTSKHIVLVGFVSFDKDYVVRIRCQNRNGWSAYSGITLCRTKKKKKRKQRLINDKVRIIRHRGSVQDGSPNNLLFSNEKSMYKSLSNQDFINEYNGWKRFNKNKSKQFTDWIIFDLGAYIEVSTVRIKFDSVHYRWGNIPKLIWIDIASYDDHSYTQSIINKYKPISYDDEYHNNPSDMSGVLIQLRQKRMEEQQVFESIWHRLTIVECKKKSGWQDFHLAQVIDESKRKAQYFRIHFVNNFDCNIEHYSKFVVEQIAFVGIQYDD